MYMSSKMHEQVMPSDRNSAYLEVMTERFAGSEGSHYAGAAAKFHTSRLHAGLRSVFFDFPHQSLLHQRNDWKPAEVK
jgi:hypothetical protein